MLKRLSFCVVVGVVLNSSPVYAHHSFSATFTNETITVEGVVDEVKFSNPHVIVYFNVTDDKGKTTRWMTEGAAATLMRGRGWSKDTLNPGDYIRVTGNSSRNGSPMVSTGTLVFVDPVSGKVLGTPGGNAVSDVKVETSIPMQLADGHPNLTGAWVMGNNDGGRGGRGDGGRRGDDGPPDGATRGSGGGGQGRGRGGAIMPYTEEAAALQASFDPKDDPQVQCKPPGLVRQAVTTPHPVKITQYDDHVVIAYEEYGGVRTIYFDDRDLVGGEHTNLGQSIARYEGQKLIVETTHLLGNLTNPGGNALSDQTETVETYYRKEDVDGQSSLVMDVVVTDPGYLTAPWTSSWEKYYSAGYDFIEVDCQVPY
jgi:hypothetical protein